MTSVDPRTAHLARALFADLDYVLGVDPNTLAAFCVRVLDEWDAAARAKGNGHAHACLVEFGVCTCGGTP